MDKQDKPTKLNNLRLELLKIFSTNLSEEELMGIKNLLSVYFAEKATRQMDRLWEERNGPRTQCANG